MHTTTTHKIHCDDNAVLEVEQQNGFITIKRINADGTEGFNIWIGNDEFRAIVGLLKPLANASTDETLDDLIKRGRGPLTSPPIWCGAKQ